MNKSNYRIYKDFGKGYEEIDITNNQELADRIIVDDCMKLLIIKHDFINKWDEVYRFEINNNYFEKQKTRVKKR